MEEGQAKRGGRRRRPPGRKPAGEAPASAEPPANTSIAEAAAPAGAPNTDAPPAENRSKRTRNKPKRPAAPTAEQAAPSGAAAPPAAPSTGEPLTWQQQSMLNVAAPDFRPTVALGSPQALSGRAGPRPPRRKAKKTAPLPDADAATPYEDNGEEEDADEAPHCLLCCSEMELASFGHCGHVAACGPCCLRLRMCYGRTDCPLCKADLSEVVIAPWRPDLPAFSFFLDHPASAARSRPGELGTGCILADKWQPPPRQPSNRLLHDLVRSTGLACAICDPEGRHPFARPPQLEAHVRERHGSYLCGMCLREGREFPLDATLYASEAEAAEHAAATHPRCDFCWEASKSARGQRFFDGDALWRHMVDRHHRCQLCTPDPGGSEPWFADLDALRSHLGGDHFACEDPDCAACLVAFTTAEELRRHHLERHSARMPRWNSAAARPLPLDIQFVRRPAAEGGGGRGENRGRRRGDSGPGGGGGRQQRNQRPAEWAQESDGGVRIIDDDLGMLYESIQGTESYGGGYGRGYGGGNNGRAFVGADFAAYAARERGRGGRGPAPQEEAFPSLAASAAEAVADRGEGRGVTRRPPPLVKHTVRCPCGRRITYPVLEEGQPVPPLECDAVCRLEGRRRALADAFGVDDPEHHLSTFDRRPAVWSGDLLAAARQDTTSVAAAERQLAAFVADRSQKRLTLDPMPRAERWLWHALAEQYGIATASTGQEPRRCVELFKTGAGVGIPSRLLSKVAATVTDEEVAVLLEAASGHPLRVTDIAPTCDLRYYLRRWDGRFKTEWEGGSAATVTFEKEEDRQEALDTFGGGIRGLFLVDRGWRPKTGVATGETHGGGAAPWAGGEQREQGGRTGADWRGVATLPQGMEGEDGEAAVRSGWAVIGGKKVVRPRVAAPAAAAMAAGGSAAGPGPASNFAALSLDEK